MVSAVNLNGRALYEPLTIEGRWVEIQPLNQSSLTKPGPRLECLDITGALLAPRLGELAASRSSASISSFLFGKATDSEIKKFNEKLQERVDDVERVLQKLQLADEAYAITVNSPPKEIEKWVDFEEAVLAALWVKNAALIDVIQAASALEDKTNSKHRDKYVDQRLIGVSEYNHLKDLHRYASHLLDQAKALYEANKLVETTSLENKAYASKIISLNLKLIEAFKVSDSIFLDQTPESKATEQFERFSQLKNEIHSDLDELNKSSESISLNVNMDWNLTKNSLSDRESDIQFYLNSIQSNRNELLFLQAAGESEYVRKSLLFESKLIKKGLLDSAAKFATAWVSELPKNAAWECVQAMYSLIANSFEKIRKEDVYQFREALDGWLQERPDLQLALSSYSSEAQESNENRMLSQAESAALVKGHLSQLTYDLSFEANRQYGLCQAIMPAEPIWKTMRALFHVSAMQWSQAKRVARDLPEEHASIVRSSLAVSKYQTFSFLSRLSGLALSSLVLPLTKANSYQGIEDSPANIAIDAVQSVGRFLSDQEMAGLWVPYVSSDITSEVASAIQPSGISIGILLTQILSDVSVRRLINKYCPNERSRIWHRKYVETLTVQGLTGISLVTHSLNSVFSGRFSMLSLAAGLLSSSSIFSHIHQTFANPTSPEYRAFLMTMQEASSMVLPFNLISSGKEVIAGCVKNIAIKCGAEGLYTKVVNVITKLVGKSGPLLALATIVSVITLKFFISYPKARAACKMEDATALCYQENYDKALEVLNQAKDWWGIFGDKKTVAIYATCIPFLKSAKTLRPTEDHKKMLQEYMVVIDPALERLSISDYYMNTRVNLLYCKIVAYINVRDFDIAKIILEKEKFHPIIWSQIVIFGIDEAENLYKKNRQSAEEYFTNFEKILWLEEYKTIFQKYWELIKVQNSDAEKLYRERLKKREAAKEAAQIFWAEQSGSALEHGASEHEKDGAKLTPAELESSITNGIPLQTFLKLQIDPICELIKLTNKAPGMLNLYDRLNLTILDIYATLEMYDEMSLIFQLPDSPIHENFVAKKIAETESLFAQDMRQAAISLFDNLHKKIKPFSLTPLIGKYWEYLVHWNEAGNITRDTPEHQINNLLDDLQFIRDFSTKKMRTYQLDKKMDSTALHFLTKACRFSQASELIRIQGIDKELQILALIQVHADILDYLSKNNWDETIKFLSEIELHFAQFSYIDLIKKFKAYCNAKAEETKQNRILSNTDETFENYVKDVKAIPQIKFFLDTLLQERLNLYLCRNEFQKARDFLNTHKIDDKQTKNQIVIRFIERQTKPDSQEWREADKAFSLRTIPLSKYYVKFSEVHGSTKNDNIEIAQIELLLNSINQISDLFSKTNHPIPKWLQHEKILILAKQGLHLALINDRANGLKALEEAEFLIPKENRDPKEESFAQSILTIKRNYF